MNYLRIPQEIRFAESCVKDTSFSPSMYRRVIIPTSTTKRIEGLLDAQCPFDKGVEPGSLWYMKQSPCYFIRTKALQDHSCLLYPKGDAIVPVNPQVFEDPGLCAGDILMSKDSNVGECAMVDGDQWKNHMFSGGIVRLHPFCNRYYFFAFLKHPLFKTQLLAMTARGATITHAKTLWMDCLVPFPNQEGSERVIRYVSALMQAIVEKEIAIRDKNALIDALIDTELREQQKGTPLVYQPPTVNEIRNLTRLDAGMYTQDFKQKMFLVTNYHYGYGTCEELGFEIDRGQNLQLSNIGQSIYSDSPKPNFYRLVAPIDMSEYRTVRQFRYLGNKKELDILKQGDVVFGAEGFCKGRAIILVDEVQKTITNIHGIIFHHRGRNIIRGIFLGCFLGYLRKIGLVDMIGAGGSGGSLAIGYFHHVPFPKFPEDEQAEISRCYHNPTPPPTGTPTLDTFVDWHRRWNVNLGIWELDREMKTLQRTLADVQEKIIEGETVQIPI
ncbi:MAG: hypothetical protein JW850_02615 [Thermoflexales bacterium]|nr:hypothetical protein [Thermoflexales bacterium]